jgi:hypothetical protein
MGELIIDPAVLADIRAQCTRRAAELEAARSSAAQAAMPSAPKALATPADLVGSSQEEAQRFAAAASQRTAILRARGSSPTAPVGVGRRQCSAGALNFARRLVRWLA